MEKREGARNNSTRLVSMTHFSTGSALILRLEEGSPTYNLPEGGTDAEDVQGTHISRFAPISEGDANRARRAA